MDSPRALEQGVLLVLLYYNILAKLLENTCNMCGVGLQLATYFARIFIS